jgi:hypothetical protein
MRGEMCLGNERWDDEPVEVKQKASDVPPDLTLA